MPLRAIFKGKTSAIPQAAACGLVEKRDKIKRFATPAGDSTNAASFDGRSD
jgi:hypothetical protein